MLLSELVYAALLARTSPSSAEAVMMVLGGYDGKRRTLRDVGDFLGRSYEWVRLCRDKALNEPLVISVERLHHFRAFLEPKLPLSRSQAVAVLQEGGWLQTPFDPQGLIRILSCAGIGWVVESDTMLIRPQDRLMAKNLYRQVQSQVQVWGALDVQDLPSGGWGMAIADALGLQFIDNVWLSPKPSFILRRRLGSAFHATLGLSPFQIQKVVQRSRRGSAPSAHALWRSIQQDPYFLIEGELATWRFALPPLPSPEKALYDLLQQGPKFRHVLVENLKAQGICEETTAALLKHAAGVCRVAPSVYALLSWQGPMPALPCKGGDLQHLGSQKILTKVITHGMKVSGVMALPKAYGDLPEGRYRAYNLLGEEVGVLGMKGRAVWGLRKALTRLHADIGDTVAFSFVEGKWHLQKDVFLKHDP